MKLTAFFGAAAVVLVAGCGGGTGTEVRSAGVTMRIQWPEATRAVPLNALSVHVLVKDSGGFQTFRVANRPGTGNFTTLTFFGLAAGDAEIVARAYPESDAQGVALAAGTSRVALTAQNQANGTVTLTSTVDRIRVTPATGTLAPQETTTLIATALDAAGDIVLLAPSKTRWRSDSAAVATVDSTGKVRAIAAGTTQVTFTDDESGKSGAATVTVAAP